MPALGARRDVQLLNRLLPRGLGSQVESVPMLEIFPAFEQFQRQVIA